jgi:hypothetical protein
VHLLKNFRAARYGIEGSMIDFGLKEVKQGC